MRRRELLAGSGTVAAIALSGYTGAATDSAPGSQVSLPSDIESVFELVPAESTIETSVRHIVYSRVDGQESEPGYPGVHGAVDEFDEIDADEVAETALVIGDEMQLAAITGSFEQPEIGDNETEGWAVGEVNGDPLAAADGKLVIALGDDSDDTIDAAIATANGDEASVLSDSDVIKTMVEHLDSMSYVTIVPDASEVSPPGLDTEVVDAVGIGLESPHGIRSDDSTLENGYVFHLSSSAADVDDEWVHEQLRQLEEGEVLEASIDRSDAFIHVDAVVEQPPERDRDAAPDATVRVRSNADEGVATFEHTDGESIDADMLEVWQNGDLADDQLADEYTRFAEGDTFELETGPIADVGLRWFDEDEDVYYYYGTTTVGRESFETTHDYDADTVEITYTGEREADPELLELVHRTDDGASTDRSAVEGLRSLTAGETITVEDVTLGDRVSLDLAVPANPNRGQRSLASYRIRPPRMFLSSHGETVTARYRDDQDRDADEFRVLADDEPAATQFTDVTETLSDGDAIELGEVDHGTHIVVEWLEPDEPAVVAERVVRPNARVDLTYDDGDGTVTIDHVEGVAIDADELKLRAGDDPMAVQPADEYDTFEPGDSVTVESEPFVQVELVWEGPEETEYSIGRTTAGRDLLDAEYDHDAREVELVYTGSQPADPSFLSVTHRQDGPTDADANRFEQAYETLTDGDSIVLEDVAIEDRITVMVVQEGENHSSRRSLFHFTPEPNRSFHFDDREDGLVAVYREQTDRDADSFELLVDGEPAETQPADRHETLTVGDELELGSFDAGTELTVQWVVPDEPRSVRSHVVVPTVEFDIEYDADTDEVTVEHGGGDAIDADDLGVIVEPTRLDPVGWDEYETVSEGDTTTIDAIDESSSHSDRDPTVVAVMYRENTHLTSERIET
ncbi:uncharacterized protein Nmag_0038 [Natrialba magadii ATCC 43099]|uniref:Uncharacterized protein n=1 Tax=Natrialba magadii (strain ATCC 43099 / DSM 3394 / CCM 3739 / CIP 104546 / IAM 13178 / JCM 8861 / NBRC 102185 / NCIMB 2190 / MS3) TaxID=547559 RepID=D3SVR8_NATMM|nr:type IV pilin N-terminal domain-containing protein [Natrialba magadii]ADD03637.1 uncharacterized protein Nmag_0038 [Natrialba magadii ATCC 43099]ELY34404.1 hypothetical protein C500_00677 [Natrialba magadii ATCC 43099]